MTILAAITKLIAKKPLTFALVGVILGLLVGLGVTSLRLKEVRAEAAEARAALSAKQAEVLVCEANTTTLENELERQNRAIQEARRQYEASADKARKTASEVLNEPLPTASAPGAKAMNEWLDGLQ